MLNLFKKKRNRKPPSQIWMTWGAIALLIYAVISNNIGSKTNTASTDKTTTENIISDTKKALKLDSLDNKFVPQTIKKLTVQDTLSGAGIFATCGQKATVNYRKLPSDDDFTPLTFTIGEGRGLVALEQGVVGMAKGGKRMIYTPENEQFEVELTDISPTLPDFSAYRIFGQNSGDMSGNGNIYKCGMPVKIHVSIWSVEGKKLFDSKENNGNTLAFTIGKSEVFLGLEQGVLGMAIPSLRSLIVPPAFQKNMNGNKPAIDFHLPRKQAVIVDVEAIL